MSRDMAHRLGMTPNKHGMYQFGVTQSQSITFVTVREDTGAVSVSVASYDAPVIPTQRQQEALARWALDFDASKWIVFREEPSMAFAYIETVSSMPAHISAIFAR